MAVRSTRKPGVASGWASLRVLAMAGAFLMGGACSSPSGAPPPAAGSGGGTGTGGAQAGRGGATGGSIGSGGSGGTAAGTGGGVGTAGASGTAGVAGNAGAAGMPGGGGSDAAAPGNDAPSTTPDAPADTGSSATGTPGANTVVTGFAGAHVYFVGKDDNKRTIDANVTFPAMPSLYERITLTLALRCPPAGGCDFWDRRAFLGVVRRDGDKETVTEIARFMTPYRLGARWTLDVTSLRPLLSGPVTLRVFIDTWVGPGHAQGAGWLVDASFDWKGGIPARTPIAVIPLWDETQVDFGDPAKPPGMFAPTRKVPLPAGATSYEIRSFITGHGQGNTENCAEFCPKTHGFKVGDQMFQRQVWRADCATTAVPNQAGTWQYPRAGWCPGATVVPWVENVTAAVSGTESTILYGISTYENRCRPEAAPCTACTLGAACAFDGGVHTPPLYMLSAVLIAYR